MVERPFDVEIRVGEVLDAESFPEANEPAMTKLWIDLGDEEGRGRPASWIATTSPRTSSNDRSSA